MTITFDMSVLLGIFSEPPHFVDEHVEQIRAVLGAGGAFGMVLHAEHGAVGAHHALHGVVQQVYVGDLQTGALKGRGVHRVAVILAGYLYFAGAEIFHRVVAAPVAEFQLVGFGTAGQTDHLMAQTYAEYGHPAATLFHKLNNGAHVLRVAGAVGEKHAVGSHGAYHLRRGVPGHHGDVAAAGVQASDNIQLYAAVHRHHGVFVVGRAGIPALAAADLRHGVPGDAG